MIFTFIITFEMNVTAIGRTYKHNINPVTKLTCDTSSNNSPTNNYGR